MYQCSLAVGTYKEELVHNLEVGTAIFREVALTALMVVVQVIISPELETRNINWQFARSGATTTTASLVSLAAAEALVIITTAFIV